MKRLNSRLFIPDMTKIFKDSELIYTFFKDTYSDVCIVNDEYRVAFGIENTLLLKENDIVNMKFKDNENINFKIVKILGALVIFKLPIMLG